MLLHPVRIALLLLVALLLAAHVPGIRAQDAPAAEPDAFPRDLPAARSADWQFPTPRIEVGQRLDLTVPAMDGGAPVSLRQYRGRKLILHVFASW